MRSASRSLCLPAVNVKYLLVLMVFLCLLTGVFVGTRIPISLENCGGLILLNPILSCAKAKSMAIESRAIESEIAGLKLSGGVDSMSVYFEDLDNRSAFSINAEQQYSPASLAKILTLIWYYGQSEVDPTLLEQSMQYTGGALPYEEQFSVGGITPGHSYTVSELLDSSIMNSDNNAYFFLNSHMGEERVAKTYTDFNFSGSLLAPRTTVRSYAVLFRMLYDSSYLRPRYSEKALDLLSKTTFTKGLRAGVPESIRVAHKYGESGSTQKKELHDCGIVYVPHKPYILCIMTSGQDWNALASSIADISGLVYQQVAL